MTWARPAKRIWQNTKALGVITNSLFSFSHHRYFILIACFSQSWLSNKFSLSLFTFSCWMDGRIWILSLESKSESFSYSSRYASWCYPGFTTLWSRIKWHSLAPVPEGTGICNTWSGQGTTTHIKCKHQNVMILWGLKLHVANAISIFSEHSDMQTLKISGNFGLYGVWFQ